MSSSQQDEDHDKATKVEELLDDEQNYESIQDEASDDVQGEKSDQNDGNTLRSAQREELSIKKKYGGLLPKKPPLISKDHEHAFFDSADWAIGKQGGQKPKGPLEALRPKLQPTPHQQTRSRRSTYAPADNTDDEANTTTDDHNISDRSDNQVNEREGRNCSNEAVGSGVAAADT